VYGHQLFALRVDSKFLGIAGKPIRVCERAWVERLGSN
jgi:hypothetical protein